MVPSSNRLGKRPFTPSIGVRVSLASPHSAHWGSRAKTSRIDNYRRLAKLIDPQSMKEDELFWIVKSGIETILKEGNSVFFNVLDYGETP